MINGEKIGVGIVTCNRPELFKKLILSLKDQESIIDHLIVVEDTLVPNPELNSYIISEIKDTWKDGFSALPSIENRGVGKSKNKCLKILLEDNCDHIFLIEDDIFIKNPTVFEKYIKASKVSGIQHFNFSQHGRMNKCPEGTPAPRLNITYGEETVALYPHCVGAFSYYSRKVLDSVGLIDERYFNACEHVDHTYEIIKAGYHPPFWWFADIDKSWEYLGDEEWSIEKSTISSNPKHQQMMQDADKIFVEKHGHLPGQTPHYDVATVGINLKGIKNKYGTNLTNV